MRFAGQGRWIERGELTVMDRDEALRTLRPYVEAEAIHV